jgi:hypothetical protein
MLKHKLFKGDAGLPISVDSRGGFLGGAGHPDVHGVGSPLSRDSILEADDARDSIFISEMAKRQSFLPKKARFSYH